MTLKWRHQYIHYPVVEKVFKFQKCAEKWLENPDECLDRKSIITLREVFLKLVDHIVACESWKNSKLDEVRMMKNYAYLSGKFSNSKYLLEFISGTWPVLLGDKLSMVDTLIDFQIQKDIDKESIDKMINSLMGEFNWFFRKLGDVFRRCV